MRKLRGLFIFIFLLAISCASVIFPNFNIDSVSAQDYGTNSQIIASASLPSRYNLRDDIYIGVENQNPYGTCYAYASLTSLETYLALKYDEYYDFSEMHFALSLAQQTQTPFHSSIASAVTNGGNFSLFSLYAEKEKSIVLEAEMPASKYPHKSEAMYNTMLQDYNAVNSNYYPIVKVNDTIEFDSYIGNKSKYSASELTSFRNKVKSHIKQYGSVTAGIYVPPVSGIPYSAKYYKVTNDSLIVNEQAILNNFNHLISVVGWDDTYNANGNWANPGAYICLNSWGEEFGDDGYFYVSYDDYFIEYNMNGIVDATLATTNDKISIINSQSEDTLLVSHYFIDGPLTMYWSNIIDVSSSRGSKITYIDSFVKGSSSSFYVKFFDTYNNASVNLNTVGIYDQISTTKYGDYVNYTKYKLDNPIEISGDFMVIASKVKDATDIYSLESVNSLPHTYYNHINLGIFEDFWQPEDGKHYVIPTTIYTDKTCIKTHKFNGNLDSFVYEENIQNNAIFYNKTLSLRLENAILTSQDISKIRIKKLNVNSATDVSTKFSITASGDTVNIKMIDSLDTRQQYILVIPVGTQKIYRVFEVQEALAYPITYHLNGGTANNPSGYTDQHTSLILNSPTKPGYQFVGWYTDSNLTQPFDANNLPYTELTLYAKYDFAMPTIKSKSHNTSATYSQDLNITIQIQAEHALVNAYNTLSYQWYMKETSTSPYSKVIGATNHSLSLHNVADSGYYACEVTITITDPALTSSTVTKILTTSTENDIYVNIRPFIYDMSNVRWNYTEAISYDTQSHTVEVINLPYGVTVEYSGNTATNIGNYTAHASLIYDNMNGNAIADPIEDLNWSIRKAKITVTINDITSLKPINLETLSTMYSCTIDNEYLPAGIVSLQDKINFLELQYVLQDTLQPNIKTITATYKTFTPDIYEIEIIDGEYSVVVYNLSSNNIRSSSETGFVIDCLFNATEVEIDNTTKAKLNDLHLNSISSYRLTYSYIKADDKIRVFIPLDRDIMFEHITVYRVEGDKLVKVDNIKAKTDGIYFTTAEDDAQYIIVKDDLSHTTNTQIIVVICILGGFVIIIGYVIVLKIKRKRNEISFY